MYYELVTMTLPFGTSGLAAAAVQADSQSPTTQGTLLGCWFSDIGVLNQLVVLRGFSSREVMAAERQRVQAAADPYGCATWMQSLDVQTFQGFPWMAPVVPSHESGVRGPVYEIRCYGIRPGGLQPTIDLWERYVPARHALSPCVVAMVALDGPLRFVNIWAYASLDERQRIRAQAVADGLWPPQGGPAHLSTTMSSTIVLPTSVSPLV